MTRELFTEIINNQMWIPLFCISIAYSIGWFIYLKLGLLVLGVHVNFQKIYPMCILGFLYSFWVKQLLPFPLAGLALPIFVAVLLWLTVRGLPLLKYGWASLTILLTVLASDTFIQAPLCAANPRIAEFLLQSAWGYVVGTGLESTGSLLALFLLPKLMPKLKAPLILIPPIESKPDRFDFSALLVSFSLYFMVYLAAIVLQLALINSSRLILMFLLFQWGSMILMIAGHFQTIKSMQKKFEMEKFDLIAEKAQLATEKEELAAEKAKLAADKANLEARVNQLEEKTLALAAVNEQLAAKKIDPGEAAREMLSIGKKVIDYANEILEQQRTYFVPDDSGGPVREVHLTPREKSVLALVGQAKNNQQIAEALGLEESYIRNIIYNLNTKLGTGDRAEMVLFAIKSGIVEIKK